LTISFSLKTWNDCIFGSNFKATVAQLVEQRIRNLLF